MSEVWGMAWSWTVARTGAMSRRPQSNMTIDKDYQMATRKFNQIDRAGILRISIRVVAAICSTCALIGCAGDKYYSQKDTDEDYLEKYFPQNYIAEPLEYKKNSKHTSKEFTLTRYHEQLIIRIGFIRPKIENGGQYLRCLVMPMKSPDRKSESYRNCPKSNPGIRIKWILMNTRNQSTQSGEYNSLIDNPNSTWSADVRFTIGNPERVDAGSYIIIVEPLNDYDDISLLRPHILITKPYFGKFQ